MSLLKLGVRWLFARLYKVEVRGLEHYERAGGPLLIVANHASYLDGMLLALFLPHRLTFAVNTHMAKQWWVRLGLAFVDFFTLDPINPLSVKSLIKLLRASPTTRAVIFPEGRITVTGALMKVYQGPGLVAERSAVPVLPVRIDGAQYTPFSRMRGRVRLRWFPKITFTVLPPRHISLPAELKGRARRTRAGAQLQDIMTEMMFSTTAYRRTLMDALLDARDLYGGDHVVAEDVERAPVTYDDFTTRACILGTAIARETERGENVGVLLPTAVANVITFFALHMHGRVPAMMNFSTGTVAMLSALDTAHIRRVYTSRRFVQAAKLQAAVHQLAERATVVYLEDLRARISHGDKIKGWLAARAPRSTYRRRAGVVNPDDPAVVLFTSGTEGTPKGVVLSHANLLANRAQVAARVDFTAQDQILNALPLFHSFGLTGATLVPLLSGVPVFLYPSPLHYRIVPEIAYDINATILFGTNTFLAGYARFAHPYDFYSVRYVFAGAERLQEETRRAWIEKFGKRILEGYGATEASPVLALNTAMDYRAGSVGRALPGLELYLAPVAGIEQGGRLQVRGPNVMLGYLQSGSDELIPPRTERGEGWYDTGDIVEVDADGFIWIRGRVKRFAKVGGEMISLAAVEALAERAWPGVIHAAVSLPDPAKGERVVLLTENMAATRQAIQAVAHRVGMAEILVPRIILPMHRLPLLGTGKVDYRAVRDLAEQQLVSGNGE